MLSAEHSRITNMVRFGMHVPGGAPHAGAAPPKRFYDRWYDLGISFVAPVFGIGTVIMAAFSPANEVPLIGGRLLLASFFFYFMIGLRLRAALRANLIVFGALLVVAFLARHHAHRDALPTCMFTLFTRQHHRHAPARTRWSMRIARRFSSIGSSPKSPRTTA